MREVLLLLKKEIREETASVISLDVVISGGHTWDYQSHPVGSFGSNQNWGQQSGRMKKHGVHDDLIKLLIDPGLGFAFL